MDLVPLQNEIHSFAKEIFSRQISSLYFGKGNLCGEKIT
jgi:hypothetical protein